MILWKLMYYKIYNCKITLTENKTEHAWKETKLDNLHLRWLILEKLGKNMKNYSF